MIEQNQSEPQNVVDTLSKKQRLWLEDYLIHGNATKAAEKAGFAHPDKQGPRLKKHPKMQAAIKERLDEMAMPANEVLARLSQQARAEYAHYLTAEGKVDLAQLIADNKGHLIKKLKPGQYGLEVEFYDAHAALVDVGRYHGLFKDNVSLDIDVSGLSDKELDELDSAL